MTEALWIAFAMGVSFLAGLKVQVSYAERCLRKARQLHERTESMIMEVFVLVASQAQDRGMDSEPDWSEVFALDAKLEQDGLRMDSRSKF